jgi:hypothetical protein
MYLLTTSLLLNLGQVLRHSILACSLVPTLILPNHFLDLLSRDGKGVGKGDASSRA